MPYREYAVTLERMSRLLQSEAKKEIAQRPQELCISGTDIMQILSLKPGPLVGIYQQKVFESYLSGNIENRREELLALLAQLAH